MGCDIHSYVEVRKDGRWQRANPEFKLEDWQVKRLGKETGVRGPFDWRSYGVFGFLAGVRNYSEIPPLSEPRGLPKDASPEVMDESDGCDWHSYSYLTVAEMAAFDYSKTFSDMRVTRQTASNVWNGAARAYPGEETVKTFKEFLGAAFFEDLEVLKGLGKPEDVRIVFWFDN